MACPLSAGCGCQGYRVVWGRVLAGCGGSQGRLGPVWAAPGVLGASMLAWVALLGLVARVAASAACGTVHSHWGCMVLVAGVRLSHHPEGRA